MGTGQILRCRTSSDFITASLWGLNALGFSKAKPRHEGKAINRKELRLLFDFLFVTVRLIGNMRDSIAATPKQPSRHGSSRRQILLRAGAIALGTTLVFGIAEFGLRLADIGMPSLYVPDDFCGSRLRPSTSGVWIREGHGHITVNSSGFRGPEISAEKAAGVFRIAVLGDSYIEALQVNENASLCFQIQYILNTANRIPNRKYEVINCGVSGYGTAQELQMLRHHVLQLQPDAVLLAVYPENDIRNNLRSLDGDPARPYFTTEEDGTLILDDSFRSSVPFVTAASVYERRKAFLVNGSHVLQMLKHAKERVFNANNMPIRAASVETSLKASVEDAAYVYSESTNIEHQRAWQITEHILEELCRECRVEKIPIFVFTVSSPIQCYPDPALRRRIADECGVSDLFYSELRFQRICSATSAEFYPLASALQEVTDSSGTSLHGFPDSGIDLGHWNEQGHGAAARILTNWLASYDLFRLSPHEDSRSSPQRVEKEPAGPSTY